MIKLATPDDLLLMTLGRNWWMVPLRGFLAVLFGALLVGNAPASLNLLVALFGLYAFVDGAWAIASALWVTRTWFTAWPILFEGTASVAVGAFALGWPLVPRELVFAIATWGLLTGAMELIAAARLAGPAAGRPPAASALSSSPASSWRSRTRRRPGWFASSASMRSSSASRCGRRRCRSGRPSGPE